MKVTDAPASFPVEKASNEENVLVLHWIKSLKCIGCDCSTDRARRDYQSLYGGPLGSLRRRATSSAYWLAFLRSDMLVYTDPDIILRMMKKMLLLGW
ncbi:uncharacterized protein EAF01_004335 [Botrytis porri]|uniref:uncharacterized protein n=1 Tax=Botrytis porri TaxID=87229 RepID=UPI0018FFF837|nr:uncharacterized protein EAF01_004335 [Botrytis porri]KAF7908580.1 hypothetical protein EAF01_004335 [Botrytis porri]